MQYAIYITHYAIIHHSGACHRRGRCHEMPPYGPVLWTPFCRRQTKVQWSQIIFGGSKPGLPGPANPTSPCSLQEVTKCKPGEPGND